VNPSWLFWNLLDALRSESYRRPERDVYCSEALAARLGIAASFLAVVMWGVIG
jgi:hypothetical protein